MTTSPLKTPIEIVNAAALVTGSKPVLSFSDGAIGQMMSALYELRVRELLESNRWDFCSKTVDLVRLEERPLRAWHYAFQRPEEAIVLRGVFFKTTGFKVDYTVFEDQLHCQCYEEDQLIADISWRAPETDWPALFTSSLVDLLAADIAAGPVRDAASAEALFNRSSVRGARARFRQATEKTVQRLDINSLRNGRRRGWWTR